MKSLTKLLSCLLLDCSRRCDTTTTRDIEYVSRRVKQEGLSFLTITLPDFAKDFERSLELGHVDASSFRAFRKTGAIPRFLSGMLRQVFDVDGRLLSQPSVEAILCIRQVCLMFKKIRLECSDARKLSAIDGYAKLEEELASKSLASISSENWRDFNRVSWILVTSIFADLRDETRDILVPKHGPGAVAIPMLPNQKYKWKRFHQRTDRFFPVCDYLYSSVAAFLEECSDLELLGPEEEDSVRVIFVPKTQRTPRVIGIEPVGMQYAQQALCRYMVSRIESSRLLKGHCNFSDQTINASLALKSSLDGHLATIDLSEASDRVHKDIVYSMFRSHPLLRDMIFACRSATSTLPDGRLIHLTKFASMGSSLCFPIESLMFITLGILARLRRLSLPVTTQNIELARRSVYVYGDDIIIPVDTVSVMSDLLSEFFLKVNHTKSFSKGNFRESCGMDAYNGVRVTPVYVRRLLPTRQQDISGLLSVVSLRNQLSSAGYGRAASYLEDYVRRIGHRIPYGSDSASYICYTGSNYPTYGRYNKSLYRREVRAIQAVVEQRDDVIDGYPALMKWFLNGLSPKRDHYLRSVGSERLKRKVRWFPVY